MSPVVEAPNQSKSIAGIIRARNTHIWGFPKIRGAFLGAPIIRTIVFWGLYWGPHILGNYHLVNLVPTAHVRSAHITEFESLRLRLSLCGYMSFPPVGRSSTVSKKDVALAGQFGFACAAVWC